MFDTFAIQFCFPYDVSDASLRTQNGGMYGRAFRTFKRGAFPTFKRGFFNKQNQKSSERQLCVYYAIPVLLIGLVMLLRFGSALKLVL